MSSASALPLMDQQRVVIAEILRPRGNRGELVVLSQTDVPGRLEELKWAKVRLRDGADVEVEIEEAWMHKGDWVLKFAGVDSINSADRFRGADLWLAPGDRGTLPDGEFFQSDLIGCAVMDATTGTQLGVVENFQQYGGPALLQLKVDGREVLIPFVSALCKVDLTERTIRVDCPEGLLDL